MAIRTKRVTGGNGINYTKELDGPSDWSGIVNDTYFKDLSDGLIYWKDTTGLVIAIYETLAVNTTYAGLTGLTSTSSLVPGTWYQFAYSTKHLIGGTSVEYNDTSTHYDDGTAVKSTLVPEVEILSVLALSGSVIHVEAKSTQYPNDIIYYDMNDNLTEDSLEFRPGFITYREDTVNKISAHYDWRNVIHRRFDMDTSLDRTTGATGTEAFLGNVTGATAGFVNHDLNNNFTPGLANFETTGTTEIGPLTTPTVGTYRDYKTFVGMDFDLYKSPSVEAARFRNIKIKSSKDVAKIGASGTGAIDVVNSFYGNIANVVFFTRTAENVTIGHNASGIMFAGNVIKDIDIGDNNENIIIGGPFAAVIYPVATEPQVLGFAENISIGNSNRNIQIADHTRRITIGNNNTGFLTNYSLNVDITIGSYNTDIWLSYANDVRIGDWCTLFRVSSASSIEGGSSLKNIDLMWNHFAVGMRVGAQIATFPNGFSPFTTTQADSINAKTTIEDGVTNALVSGSSGRIGGSSKGISILQSGPDFDIGQGCVDIIAQATGLGLKVGAYSFGVELVGSQNPKVGVNTYGCKIIGSDWSEIGDYCSEVYVGNGSNISSVGANCVQVALTGSIGSHIGDSCTSVNVRGTEYAKVGNKCTNIFTEEAHFSIIEDNCSDIALNNIGRTYTLDYVNFIGTPDYGSYIYSAEDLRRKLVITKLVQSETMAGALEFTGNLRYQMSLSTQDGPQNCHVGFGSDNVYVVSSNDCVIGNNCSNIRIGIDQVDNEIGSTFNTVSLVWTGGTSGTDVVPLDTVALSANTANNGAFCHNTTIEHNSTNIKVIGYNNIYNDIGHNNDTIEITGTTSSGNTIHNGCSDIIINGTGHTGNEFGVNTTSVDIVPGFTFTNNRVLIDGKAVTLTASYDKKIYDKVSPDTERWETGIDNAGVTTTPTKLV